MSYTPPAGNAANLRLVGDYTPPAGDAANLSLGGNTPTAVIAGQTTLSFVAVGNLSSAFTAGCSSTTQFEHPYRTAAIQGSSDVTFRTDIRHIEVASATSTNFRAGATASFVSSSTTSIQCFALIQHDLAISVGSSVYAACVKIVNVPFSCAGRSFVSGKAAFNKPFAFFSIGSTNPVFRRNAVTNVDASVVSGSLAEFSSSTIKLAHASAGSATNTAFYGQQLVLSSASVSSATTFAASGVPALLASADISGGTETGFASAYSYIDVDPYDAADDTAFVLYKPDSTSFVVAA